MTKRVDLIVGARPNFMKLGPVHRALARATDTIRLRVVHTGQHYDANMSDVFFAQLGLPTPDVALEVGSGTHGQQTGTIMIRYEEILLRERPDLVVVFGDVNSTLACTVTAVKHGIPVAHVEAGLRSFDWTMPEEINRIVTDRLSSLLFTPSADGDANLAKEGIPSSCVHLVGNVMIDTLVASMDAIRRSTALELHGLKPRGYALLTLHRPSNVDRDDDLERIGMALGDIQGRTRIIFPIHPRTRQRMMAGSTGRLWMGLEGVHLVPPLPYLDFLRLVQDAAMVITDSGGIQEETTYLGVPCLTARSNTERPITVEMGTNVLVGNDPERIVREATRVLDGRAKAGRIPPLWDGRAGERIATIIDRALRDGVRGPV